MNNTSTNQDMLSMMTEMAAKIAEIAVSNQYVTKEIKRLTELVEKSLEQNIAHERTLIRLEIVNDEFKELKHKCANFDQRLCVVERYVEEAHKRNMGILDFILKSWWKLGTLIIFIIGGGIEFHRFIK